MTGRRARLLTATRRATLIACAVAGNATVAVAQSTTFKLTIFTSDAFYLGTAQVTSSPAGIDCRSESSGNLPNGGTCSADFAAGATVTLTAVPLYGGTFDGWVGACAGQSATCHVAMTSALTTSPKTIAKTYTLTVRGVGNAHGLIGNVDFWARPPLSCGIGPGGVTGGVCVTEYPANQTAWLRREESALGYARFVGYSGCGADPFDCRMVVDGPKVVTAGWMAMQIIIRSAGGNGTGKVTGTATNNVVGSFDCTIAPAGAAGVCSAIWETQTPPMSITLTATPTGNSVFAGWSGKCSGTGACVIPIQIDTLPVAARFTAPSYSLSVTAAGSGNGNVTSSPSGINCPIIAGAVGQNCSATFSTGTAVTLTADPTGGSTFGGWTGACSGAQATCLLTISATTQATARFTPPRAAAELALALLGRLTLSPAEQHELDRFGNADDTFNLGDLLALLSRTGERLPAATMSALLHAQRGNGRTP
jgi:List-Bact-rpt repeat protein